MEKFNMNDSYNPFGVSQINKLVQVEDKNGKLYVLTREGTSKEFKDNFTWGSIGLYARTMAAFANARGGYIVFGFEDNPRVAVGLKEAALQSFDNLDQAKLTGGLNEIFSPEIKWEIGLIPLSNITLGAIYTYESDNKPIVARKTYQKENANITEGDIVYRYNSRTERVKFPELKKIIDDAKNREQRAMMHHIEGIIKAGASKAAILDFKASTLQGPTGQKVLIDEELIKQISFIKEGEFDEVKGAPTLKIIGQVQPSKTIAMGSERVVKSVLTTENVINDFLYQRNVNDESMLYIQQAVVGLTSFVPIHYYRSKAGLSDQQLIEFVEKIVTRSQSKKKLLERLQKNDSMQLPPPSCSTQYISTVFRRKYYDSLVIGQLDDIELSDEESVQYFLEAVKSLDDNQVRNIFNPLIDLMKNCYKYYDSNAKTADALRRAVCRVDIAMFGDKLVD